MTTVIYDHTNKQIACDSREVANGIVHNDSSIKYHNNDLGLWFMTGDSADINEFISNFEHNKKMNQNLECSGVLVSGGVVSYIASNDGVYRQYLSEANEGYGSGGRFALSALDFGKTAKEAVEYAMTRDIYSGGKVHVYDIEKGVFL